MSRTSDKSLVVLMRLMRKNKTSSNVATKSRRAISSGHLFPRPGLECGSGSMLGDGLSNLRHSVKSKSIDQQQRQAN